MHLHNTRCLFSCFTVGKSDPLVEIFTTNDYKANTRHISRNLNPVWDETFFLPVLEKDQILRLEVFDHDAINLTQGVSWQVRSVTLLMSFQFSFL